MISVIISTYNRADKLKRAIKSVLNQTYDDFEIIIIDDKSNDNTEAVVKSFNPDWIGEWDDKQTAPSLQCVNSTSKITYIKRMENFGNDTRPKNNGISVSRGEYIAFLDDDNAFRPDHLQILINALQNAPKLDVVYGDRWVIDESGKLPSRMGFMADFTPSRLLLRNFIDTSDVLIRREALFEVGGWDERYKKYVDWNLFLRLAKAGKQFMRVPLLITDYYFHKDMKSLTVKDKRKSDLEFTPEWDPHDVEINLPFLGKLNSSKVAIYTLTYNRLEYTQKTFESLNKTAGYEFEHYIFDNGSTDGTVEWLKKYQEKMNNVHVVFSKDNKGISIASNRILDEIMKDSFDAVVKVDNDCLFLSNGWLAKMVEIWKSNHMIALSPYVQGLRDNPGGAPRIGQGQLKGEIIGMSRHLGGICHFVDARAYKIFRWSPKDFLHGMQDLEFSQYLVQNAFQMGYMENYYCEHMEGTEGQHKRYPEYFKKREIEKTTRYEK